MLLQSSIKGLTAVAVALYIKQVAIDRNLSLVIETTAGKIPIAKAARMSVMRVQAAANPHHRTVSLDTVGCLNKITTAENMSDTDEITIHIWLNIIERSLRDRTRKDDTEISLSIVQISLFVQ